jgi:hypothetical protein
MANTLLTPTQVTRKALTILHQKARFIGSINRQYDDQFAGSGASVNGKIGPILKIRTPNRYTVRSGAVMSVQDTPETSIDLTVSTQKGVDVNFTSQDLTLSLDDFSERILEPAMSVLAANIEADALSMRKDVYNQVNNTGSAATFAKLLAGRKQMVDGLTPDGDWTALLCTQDNVDLVDSLKGLFNNQASISKQYRDGVMGNTAGFDFMESTILGQQTRGSGNGSYVVTTTVTTQGQATVDVQTGTGTIKAGEIITIASVNRVHPETKASTGALHQFVNTIDSPGGSVTLTISPAMYTTGALQNIDAFPQATAAVSIAGTASTNYGQSLLYHKDAFAFVTADLILPKNQHFAAREVIDGISMRIWQGTDIVNDKFPCRIDVLYGYKTLRPQLASRLANN